MKSNKKQLIFLSLAIFSGQIVHAKLSKKHSLETGPHKEMVIPVESTGLALPQFSSLEKDNDPRAIGFVAIKLPTKFKDKESLQAARKEYTKLTRLKDAKGMDKQTLRQAYEKAIELGNYDDALFYHKYLVAKTDDKYELQTLACQKADIYFALGNYKQASQEYKKYADTYPGAHEAENVLFHYIVALNQQRPRHDQDQEVTEQVICYSEKYMLEPAYKKYVAQVKSIYRDCYTMLYEHEKSVLDFYIRTKKPVAAEGRYAYLKQKYYEDFPLYRAEILAYGCDVAQLQGDNKLYKERLAFLEKQFPSYKVAYKKKSFLNIM